MKKNVIVLLLCMSSSNVGMDQLSKSVPISKGVLKTHKAELSFYDKTYVLPPLVTHIELNEVDFLRDRLNSVMETNPDLLRNMHSAFVLYEAVKKNRHRCTELLLKCNANPNAMVMDGNTLLHMARGAQMVKLLVNYGAWVEQKNDKGETPLLKLFNNTIEQKNDKGEAQHFKPFSNVIPVCLDTARALCSAGADVNACDNHNNTALHCAAQHLHLAEIKFLLYRGAQSDVVNDQKETAYHIAEKRGRNALNAFQEWQKFFSLINTTIQDNHSLTIVSLLAHNGEQLKKILIRDPFGYCSQDIVVAEELFKKCKGDVWDELRSNISPYSTEALSLLQRVSKRRKDRMRFLELLDNNNFRDACGLLKNNPYLLHTYKGEYECDEVNALFVEKVISTASDYSQYNYLQEMMYSGFFDVDGCDASGDPLLSLLIQQPNHDNRYLDLLRAGAQVNVKDKEGYTPLLFAVKLDKEDVISILLSYGAIVNRNFSGPFVLQDSMQELIVDVYNKQTCCRCGTHDHDLSHIPCVRRHLEAFICTECYKKSFGECPVCRPFMGAFGC